MGHTQGHTARARATGPSPGWHGTRRGQGGPARWRYSAPLVPCTHAELETLRAVSPASRSSAHLRGCRLRTPRLGGARAGAWRWRRCVGGVWVGRGSRWRVASLGRASTPPHPPPPHHQYPPPPRAPPQHGSSSHSLHRPATCRRTPSTTPPSASLHPFASCSFASSRSSTSTPSQRRLAESAAGWRW